MDNLAYADELSSILGLEDPAPEAGARSAALSKLGDIDALAASAMEQGGLPSAMKALAEQLDGALDAQAFMNQLSFAIAERAAWMAEEDPEHAADILESAMQAMGSRAPSASMLEAAGHAGAAGAHPALEAMTKAMREGLASQNSGLGHKGAESKARSEGSWDEGEEKNEEGDDADSGIDQAARFFSDLVRKLAKPASGLAPRALAPSAAKRGL